MGRRKRADNNAETLESKEEKIKNRLVVNDKKFTPEEDAKLLAIVNARMKNGKVSGWPSIAEELGNDRISKQCRARYYNHLDPTINKEDWEPWENEFIINYVKQNGNKWADLSRALNNHRPGDMIKSHYNSSLKNADPEEAKKRTIKRRRAENLGEDAMQGGQENISSQNITQLSPGFNAINMHNFFNVNINTVQKAPDDSFIQSKQNRGNISKSSPLSDSNKQMQNEEDLINSPLENNQYSIQPNQNLITSQFTVVKEEPIDFDALNSEIMKYFF